MKKIPHAVLLLFSFTFSYCTYNNKKAEGYSGKVDSTFIKLSLRDDSHATDTAESNKPNPCKPYFTFDHVEHYVIDASDHDVMVLDTTKKKTNKQQLLQDALSQGYLKNLKDSSFVKTLETIGYTKSLIPQKYNEELRSIFCKRRHDQWTAYACIAVYRDIFVFKQQGKLPELPRFVFHAGKAILLEQNQIRTTSDNREILKNWS